MSRLYNHELLVDCSTIDKSRINKETGHSEIFQSKQTKYYKDVLFCFYPNKLDILFKPHYYFNDSLHNANDFTALDCIKTLKDFALLFELPVNDLIILNIEFGLNALSPIDCEDLITFAEYHGKNQFQNSSDELKYSKIASTQGKKGKVNNYKKIKFYDKGIQFPEHTDINTFRFEVKSKRTKYIKTLGITKYSDLLNHETYFRLSKIILLEFENVLILHHNVNMGCLTNKDKDRLSKYLSTYIWYKALQKHRNTFNNSKKNYLSLLDKTGYNIHTELTEIITDKLDLLLKGCADLTPQLEEKHCADLSSNIIGNRTTLSNAHPKKQCRITGIDISMQREDSLLLSHNGLWHLLRTDVELFDEIKRKYLTDKWNDSNIDIQVKEIAHNIRNVFHQRIRKEKSNYLLHKNQYNLFTNLNTGITAQ